MNEWHKTACLGVIKSIKHSIAKEGKLLDCYKHYLQGMSRNSLEIMKKLDAEFMAELNSLIVQEEKT